MSIALKKITYGTEMMTAEEVAERLALKQDAITGSRLAALASGVTEKKVGTYDTHVSDSSIHVTSSDKAKWNASQANVIEKIKLNGTELAVSNKSVNIAIPNLDSLVTQAQLDQKVDKSTYATDKASLATKTELAGKQDSLTSVQTAAVNSGVDASRIATYNSHISNADLHVQSSDKARWNSAQANVIEKIKLNGTEVAVTDKTVNLSILTSENGVTKEEQSQALAEKLDKSVYYADKANFAIKGEKQDTLTSSQLDAVNSGVTSAKVAGYDSHTANTSIHVTSSDKAKWNASQANVIEKVKVNGTEVDVTNKTVNIDVPTLETIATKTELDSKVDKTTYNTDKANFATKTELAAKQNALSSSQLAAVNSGVTKTKVDEYTSHVANSAIHVTSSEKANFATKTELATKQNALSSSQLAAVNSGVTASLLATFATQSNISNLQTQIDTINNLIGTLNLQLKQILGE